jgi:enamine deaminase RidA (YjgF/YER057c/UK114 family)
MGNDFHSIGEHVKGSSFRTSEGADEFYLMINSSEESTFSGELDHLFDSYMTAMDNYGLSEDTLVFSRFYISDIANQKKKLRESKIFAVSQKGAVSTIQQCPVKNGSLSLLVYHVKKDNIIFKKELFTYDDENRRNGAIIHGKHYDLFWIANFYGIGPPDTYCQTTEVFQSFNDILNNKGMTLFDNAMRTWVYVRDIDNNYNDMIESRKAFFKDHGLTPETRYIASTGIEGFSKEVNSLVALDGYAVNNLEKEQIVRMEALNHLSPTIDYGVTFERGTRVRFGDRSHLHISGTASIDITGKVMYISDVKKQTLRTIENIRALLASQGADLGNMAYIIAYIRNIKDGNRVREVLESEIPGEVPVVFLESSVCRPDWLVELEGVAIIPDSNDFPAFF